MTLATTDIYVLGFVLLGCYGAAWALAMALSSYLRRDKNRKLRDRRRKVLAIMRAKRSLDALGRGLSVPGKTVVKTVRVTTNEV